MKRRTLMGAGAADTRQPGRFAGLGAEDRGRLRFFCGFPPGGNADLLCRILADALVSEIGQKGHRRQQTGAAASLPTRPWPMPRRTAAPSDWPRWLPCASRR